MQKQEEVINRHAYMIKKPCCVAIHGYNYIVIQHSHCREKNWAIFEINGESNRKLSQGKQKNYFKCPGLIFRLSGNKYH